MLNDDGSCVLPTPLRRSKMPSAYEQRKEPPKKGKSIKSAFDSESYDADWTIHVEGLVGSATISPSGRDVALAS